MDQTHLRLEPAGQLLQCLLNNPFFILLQCKLYFLIAGIFKAAAATATEIKHLISEGIMGLGKKQTKENIQLSSWLWRKENWVMLYTISQKEEVTSA